MDDYPLHTLSVGVRADKLEPRWAVLFEKHIGIGLRWCTDEYMPFPLHLSLALPFVTFEMGLGKRRSGQTVNEGDLYLYGERLAEKSSLKPLPEGPDPADDIPPLL